MTVLVADTKVRHELASSEYAERRATCESAAAKLRVPSLRDATLDLLEGNAELTTEERKRALHVLAETTRTVLACEALASSDVQIFGELMFASHDSLRDLYEVSCAELDWVVDAARELRGQGVYGARMTGGGFGGCAIVVCRTSAVKAVHDHLRGRFVCRFRREPDLFTIQAACAARTLPIEDAAPQDSAC
jgi:galactokinase